MKKIFLVFGLGCFFDAPAQQQELFDINKHLLKKNTNNNVPGLKKTPALPYQQSPTDLEPFNGLKKQPLFVSMMAMLRMFYHLTICPV